jgi:hypothetical protein
MAKRKRITMLVTVSVPSDMTAAAARREVRSLITHQGNWSAEPEDVKAIAIESASWALAARRAR